LTRFAPIDGFSLAYERHGPEVGDPAVVLLHGWPGDRQDWRAVVTRLPDAGHFSPLEAPAEFAAAIVGALGG